LKRICVGRIGAPHGVRGEVKLWPFTADPLAIGRYGELFTADGTRRFEVEALRPARDHMVARLKGIADRTAAEALRNLELFVPRDRLPEIEEPDEFYHADLIGLTACDRGGRTLGSIVAVYNFGAGDLLELKPDAGGDTVLVPFTQLTVPEIDMPAGRLVIDYDFDVAKP
jgi:16S rRNA processing protein RimM